MARTSSRAIPTRARTTGRAATKNLAQGNTERVAEFVQQVIGGDLFDIEMVQRYAADYCRLRYFWNYLERI